MVPKSVQNLCDWVEDDADDLQEPRRLVQAVLDYYKTSPPLLQATHKYLFVAYKPDSYYSCWGDTSRYSSDFVMVKSNETAEIVAAYATCLAAELQERETGYTTLEVYGPGEEEVAGIIAEAKVQAETIKLARVERRRLDEERKRQEAEAFALQVRRSQYEALRAEFEPETKEETQ